MPLFSRRHFLAATGAATLASACVKAEGPEETFTGTRTPLCTASGKKPNVIFILTDDLGFGDLGYLFQNNRTVTDKLETPNLDRLAAEGVILTDHYTTAPLCVPARASLMTGKHQGHCNVRDSAFDAPIDPTMTLGTVMKAAGYATWAIGKWGIGGNASLGETAMPWHAGFDKAFIYKYHGDGHTYYHVEGYRSLVDETDTAIPNSIQKLRYDTDLFTARARAYIEEHLASSPQTPFFLFLAYTAIHGSGNAAGGGATNNTNFHIPGCAFSAQRLSTWPISAEETSAANTWTYPQFTDANGFTGNKKRYATSVKRLDDCIGFLTDTLTEKGIADNTLVIFTSDNGPTSEYDSNVANFTSAGPFKGMKRNCWEGGIREPAFAWWPGTIPPGRIETSPAQFQCWMPTLADVAGLPQPAHSDGVSLLPGMTGSGAQLPSRIYAEHRQDAGTAYGNDNQFQVVREGDFTAIRRNIASAADTIELYNVKDDLKQAVNLANDPAHSHRAAYMRHLMATCRIPVAKSEAASGFKGHGTTRPYDSGTILPAIPRNDPAPPFEIRLFTRGAATWPWVPNFRTLPPDRTFFETDSSHTFSRLPAAPPYGISITGWFTAPSNGDYTFSGSGSGGIQLWLHEAHILEFEAGDCANGRAIIIPLEAGRHPFRLYATIPPGGTPPIITMNGTPLIA